MFRVECKLCERLADDAFRFPLSDCPCLLIISVASTCVCTPSRYTWRNQILYTFINRFTSKLTETYTFYAEKRKSAIKFKKRGDRKYDDVGLKNVPLINSLPVCISTNLIVNTISTFSAGGKRERERASISYFTSETKARSHRKNEKLSKLKPRSPRARAESECNKKMINNIHSPSARVSAVSAGTTIVISAGFCHSLAAAGEERWWMTEYVNEEFNYSSKFVSCDKVKIEKCNLI